VIFELLARRDITADDEGILTGGDRGATTALLGIALPVAEEIEVDVGRKP
jgi:hypothetical protein